MLDPSRIEQVLRILKLADNFDLFEIIKAIASQEVSMLRVFLLHDLVDLFLP